MVIMSIGDVTACRMCVCILCSLQEGMQTLQSLPSSLQGTLYTHTDTTCCHITDGHNYHFLTSF